MRYATLLAVVLAVCSACKHRESGIVGAWKAKTGFNLTLEADHTFGFKESDVDEGGTWTLAGDKLHLSVTKMGGKPIDEYLRNLFSTQSTDHKLTEKEMAASIRSTKRDLAELDFQVAKGNDSLAWHDAGQVITFTRGA